MAIKEKLEKAKRLYETANADQKYVLESLFPELKESKDSEDEKIMKDMIETIKKEAKDFPSSVIAEKSNSWIAWLEKQKHEEWSLYDEKILSEVFTSVEIDAYSEEKKKEIISWLQKYRPYMHEKRDEQKPAGNSEKKSEDAIEEKDMTEYEKGFECGKQLVLKYPEDFNLREKFVSAWSEEDERMIDTIISDLERHGGKESSCYSSEINYLKTLKDRVKPQPKQEWGEEDKRKIDKIYSILLQAADTHAFSTTCRLIGDKECVELQDFLKSLRPQNTWKPSDRELGAILTAVGDERQKGSDVAKELLNIYQQLKKLREDV